MKFKKFKRQQASLRTSLYNMVHQLAQFNRHQVSSDCVLGSPFGLEEVKKTTYSVLPI